MTTTPASSPVDVLRDRGFTGDFVIDTAAIPPGVRCRTCGRGQLPERALITETTPGPARPEPEDPSILLGLTCPRCTTKGVLVVAHGADVTPAEQEVISILRD